MDKFQTIGAGFAFLLLLIQLYERRATIRAFCANLTTSLRGSRRVFRRWRYWRSHKPKCVVSLEPLKIRKVDDSYFAEMDAKIDIEGRDKRYTTTFGGNVIAGVYHKEREVSPYRLNSKPLLDRWTLDPEKPKPVPIKVHLQNSNLGKVPPLFGKRTRVKITIYDIKLEFAEHHDITINCKTKVELPT